MTELPGAALLLLRERRLGHGPGHAGSLLGSRYLCCPIVHRDLSNDRGRVGVGGVAGLVGVDDAGAGCGVVDRRAVGVWHVAHLGIGIGIHGEDHGIV